MDDEFSDELQKALQEENSIQHEVNLEAIFLILFTILLLIAGWFFIMTPHLRGS